MQKTPESQDLGGGKLVMEEGCQLSGHAVDVGAGMGFAKVFAKSLDVRTVKRVVQMGSR